MPSYDYVSKQDVNAILAKQPRFVSKVIAAAGTSFTTAASPVALFTVSGPHLARVFATIETAVTSTGATGTIAIGVTGATDAFIAATTANGTNFPSGSVWTGDTSPTLRAEVFSGTSLNWALLNNTNIIATIATNNMTAGALTFHCQFIPLSSVATIIPA